MPHRKPIIGGNWKMNTRRESAVALAREVADRCSDFATTVEVVVFPPFPYLDAVRQALRSGAVGLGAQDVHCESDGAYTGEVSTAMLLDLAVGYVIVGHSERRHVIGESDDLINRKVRAALDAGLVVLLCLGETLEQRESGQAEEVTLGQLADGLNAVSEADMSRVVIAYEPVWAIGTGRTATADDAQIMHSALRADLARRYDARLADSVRIQYGGSVKPDNAADLISMPDIDGFLVGGASLMASDFVSIVEKAGRTSSLRP